MSPHPPGGAVAASPTRAARARVAVAALFATNGAVFATLVPRYPDIRDELGLSNAALGSAIAAFSLSALFLGLLAAPAVARWGSARVATRGMALLAAAIATVSAAPTWAALAAVLFLAGGLDAVVDVAQNAHGLRVQREYGRSIVHSFHGVWSVGAVAGGLLGSAAAGLDVPLGLHLGVTAAGLGVVALVAGRGLLPGPDRPVPSEAAADPHASAPATPPPPTNPVRASAPGRARAAFRPLAALGVLAACGAVVEDAGSSWGAIYLRDELDAGPATAGLAFVALQAAMTVGRLTGDRAVDRVGQRAVGRVGGVVVAAGMGAGLLLATTPAALVGFALAGLGVATLVPAAMHAADELPGLAPGTGLTVVSWLLRVGFLVSAPTVGAVADATSVRAALLGVVGAGLVVAVVGRVLPGSPRPWRPRPGPQRPEVAPRDR